MNETVLFLKGRGQSGIERMKRAIPEIAEIIIATDADADLYSL